MLRLWFCQQMLKFCIDSILCSCSNMSFCFDLVLKSQVLGIRVLEYFNDFTLCKYNS